MKLSYTKIKTYLECPYKFKLIYIDRIPQKPKSYFKFSSIIHHVLHKYHFYQRSFNLEELLTCYNRTWEQRKGNLYQEGKRILIDYYKKMGNQIPYSSEQRFSVRVGNNILIGKIDRIDKTGGEFSILDYKLNKNILTLKEIKDNLQLNLYTLGFFYLTNMIPSKVGFYFLRHGRLLFVEKNKQDIEKTKNLINYTAKKIAREEFNPKEGKYCSWCDYKQYCLSKEIEPIQKIRKEKLIQLSFPL